MVADVREPLLDPDRMHKIIRIGAQHFEDSVRLLINNLFPQGYMVGMTPPKDKLERFMLLIVSHDRNLALAQDPSAEAGDRQRAHQELLEEERLRQEVMGSVQSEA